MANNENREAVARAERAERAERRIAELAVMFGIPDGGRYLNDWKAVAEAWNRRPAVNIALPKPALAQTDGYKTADPSGEPTKCAVCGCLSLDGKAYFPARKEAKP